MTTIIILLALTTALVLAIERHHRSTWHLTHAPLGADATGSWNDLDLDHVLHDLSART
jgi:hypothetical protein